MPSVRLYRKGMKHLLTPREVEQSLRYPRGRSIRLAKAGLLPAIFLPDGEIRFDMEAIEKVLANTSQSQTAQVVQHG